MTACRTSGERGILVTGADGYLGRHVVAQFRRIGRDVWGLSRSGDGIRCDMLDQARLQAVMDEYRPGAVVHCAAIVPGRGSVSYDDEGSAAANTDMLRNLLHAGAKKIVFISSMTVYAPFQAMPVCEAETAPQSAYAKEKVACERLLLASAGRSQGAILRLPGLFGPPRSDGLVYSLCNAIITGKPLRLPEAPIMWAAMHVEDAAAAIARAAVAIAEGRDEIPKYIVANVGYPGTYSISRLVDDLGRLTHVTIRSSIEHPDFAMDLTTLAGSFGLPQATYEERLKEMLQAARTQH